MIQVRFANRNLLDSRIPKAQHSCVPRRSLGEVQMPCLEDEIAHLRERAAHFVALAKEHRDNDRVRQRLMTVAADLYTKAAELEEKLKRGAA
jgi:uncharacterized protein YigA (DUF484 family)